MKKIIVSFFLVCLLCGCQSFVSFKRTDWEKAFLELTQLQEPSPDLPRTNESPLVALIPGLNLPMAPIGSRQFKDLPQLLDQKKFPVFVVAYSEKIYPVSAVAGLYSERNSIAITRVIPIISSAINKENHIRKSQGIESLKNLDLIAYSQGSVLALDLIKSVRSFRKRWKHFIKETGKEWETLKQDPTFKLLQDHADNFLVLENIRIQRQQQFKKDFDFHRLYQKISKELNNSFNRFDLYLQNPKKVFPQKHGITLGEKGFPREYPKTKNFFSQMSDQEKLHFWLDYVKYEDFLPVKLRLFSIAGSFFGSPKANNFYQIMKVLPNKADRALAGSIQGQIKDTLLGSRYHLDTLKFLIEQGEQNNNEAPTDFYFIIGTHGLKGDGVVGQSSAHLSSHLYTKISLADLFLNSSELPLKFDYVKLPSYPLTAISASHLPYKQWLLFKQPGIAQITSKSPVYPFLLSYLEKDFKRLERLHSKQNHALHQFMLILDLPKIFDLNKYRVLLSPKQKGIKITGRFYNNLSHAYVWTGLFTASQKKSAKVLLSFYENSTEKNTVELTLIPGTNHFVEIVDDQQLKNKGEKE